MADSKKYHFLFYVLFAKRFIIPLYSLFTFRMWTFYVHIQNFCFNFYFLIFLCSFSTEFGVLVFPSKPGLFIKFTFFNDITLNSLLKIHFVDFSVVDLVHGRDILFKKVTVHTFLWVCFMHDLLQDAHWVVAWGWEGHFTRFFCFWSQVG